jgi:RNA polymerase sigma-70 factor (ECF subfamily)
VAIDFDWLLDKYEKPIYNLIFRLVGDRDEAADLTQETFVAAYGALSRFQGKSSEFTWLYRIAVNKCKNRFKEKERRRNCEVDALVDYDALSVGRVASPEALVGRQELVERIEQAISELPHDYRIVAVLRELHGLSYEEIARVADLTVDVVRTRIARARGMLRRKLEPYLVE